MKLLRKPAVRRLAGAVAMTSILVTACAEGGAAGGSQEAFCDAARERRDVFTGEGGRQVSPGIIGTLRELSEEAPTEVRVEFEQALSAESDDERAAAFASIKRYLRDECDIDLAG